MGCQAPSPLPGRFYLMPACGLHLEPTRTHHSLPRPQSLLSPALPPTHPPCPASAPTQVYTQPVFQLMEQRLSRAMGRPAAPLLGRALLRVVYVLLITFVAILVPFFGALMGLIGAGRVRGSDTQVSSFSKVLWLLHALCVVGMSSYTCQML